MDTYGGGFNSSESYVGAVSHLNIWSQQIRGTILKLMARGCSAFEGDVVYWSDFRNDVRGDTYVSQHAVCGYASKFLSYFLLF